MSREIATIQPFLGADERWESWYGISRIVRTYGKYGRICLSHMFCHDVFLETQAALDKLSLISLLELQPCKPWGTKCMKSRPRLSIFFKAVEDVPAGGSIDVEVDSVVAVHLVFQIRGIFLSMRKLA